LNTKSQKFLEEEKKYQANELLHLKMKEQLVTGRKALNLFEEKIRTKHLKTLEDLKIELSALEAKKKEFIKQIEDDKIKSSKKINESVPGFLDQIMMLERLSSAGKTVPKFDPATNKIIKGEEIEIYGSAFWPIWLVRLLFMIVEIAPVIFKFMIWKSSYDYMQDNVSQILEAKQGISLELIPDENNNLHKVKENYNARRIVEVAKRQNELEKENAIHTITLYAEKEREEMEEQERKLALKMEQDKKMKAASRKSREEMKRAQEETPSWERYEK
jgi:hypothetical protein